MAKATKAAAPKKAATKTATKAATKAAAKPADTEVIIPAKETDKAAETINTDGGTQETITDPTAPETAPPEEAKQSSKKKKLINYSDALEALNKGKQIAREDWSEDTHLEVVEGVTYHSLNENRKDLYVHNSDNAMAEDWYVK